MGGAFADRTQAPALETSRWPMVANAAGAATSALKRKEGLGGSRKGFNRDRPTLTNIHTQAASRASVRIDGVTVTLGFDVFQANCPMGTKARTSITARAGHRVDVGHVEGQAEPDRRGTRRPAGRKPSTTPSPMSAARAATPVSALRNKARRPSVGARCRPLASSLNCRHCAKPTNWDPIAGCPRSSRSRLTATRCCATDTTPPRGQQAQSPAERISERTPLPWRSSNSTTPKACRQGIADPSGETPSALAQTANAVAPASSR